MCLHWSWLVDGITISHGTEPVVKPEGFEANNFHCQFVQAGENSPVDDVSDWLECDEGDLGQQIWTEEITAKVLHPKEGNNSEAAAAGTADADALPSRHT